eukprot:111480_1
MASEDNDMYEGGYIWEIKGSKLSKMKKAKNEEEFVSDTFEMTSMNWCIEGYPNGNRDNNVGAFNVFLKLLSSPPQNETKTIVFSRIYCQEYHSSYSTIIPYKKGDSYGWG